MGFTTICGGKAEPLPLRRGWIRSRKETHFLYAIEDITQEGAAIVDITQEGAAIVDIMQEGAAIEILRKKVQQGRAAKRFNHA
jgi:hypothetical protein